MNTPPLFIRDNTVAPILDLVKASVSLLATPTGDYIFRDQCSEKFVDTRENQGSQTQVNRLTPLISPDFDNLGNYTEGGSLFPVDVTDPANLQALDFTKVIIQLTRKFMDIPLAAKLETLQMSQIDLQSAAEYALYQNFNEFQDDMCLKEIRDRVCTKIYGRSLRASASVMQNNPGTDGYGVAVDKEFKLRMSKLHVRPYNSQPGGDKQALDGAWVAITDEHGMQTYEEDPLYRDYAIRNAQEVRAVLQRDLVKGFVSEFEQVIHLKSNRMRNTDVGPSGSPFSGSEVLYMGTDPVLIEGSTDGVQGYIGQSPVIYAEMGTPEVKSNNNNFFGETQIVTWFHTMVARSTEQMSQATADALTEILEAIGTAPTALVNSSRFIHQAYVA